MLFFRKKYQYLIILFKGAFKLPHLDPERGHVLGRFVKPKVRNKNARSAVHCRQNIYVTLDWICWEARRLVFSRELLTKLSNPFLFCRIICYLTGILLAFLVLIGVIVVLTLMVANKELGIIKEIDF